MNALTVSMQSDSVPSLQRDVLMGLFDAALKAVDPLHVMPQYLPAKPKGRTVVVGAGKAAARMALALEQHWDGPLQGLVVTRYGHGEATQKIEVVQAGHPVPDDAGAVAAQRILASVQGLTADDLVIALISGGGSSLLSAPVQGVTLQDIRDLTQALLKSGATIHDMNCVRKHLSSIQGGRLGQACGLASVHTLVISDVPGDDPRTVASGPTLPEDSTPADALGVLQRYKITPPSRVLEALKPGIGQAHFGALGARACHVIATAQLALDSAAAHARQLGLTPIILGNAIEAEARHAGSFQAGIARQIALHAQPAAMPAVILSGGETTVTVRGTGRGGRNAEYLLSHALACKDLPNVWGLAADTDGIDGSETNAGAIFDPHTVRRALAMGMRGEQYLANNDAFSFFDALGDLVTTGPTRTNVNDLRATLIL